MDRFTALVETVFPGSDHTFAWRHVSCLTLIPPTRSNDGLQSASINQSRPNVSPQPSRRLENRKENKTDSPSSYLCLKTLPCCVNIFSQNLNFKSLKCWLQWINWQQPDHGIDTSLDRAGAVLVSRPSRTKGRLLTVTIIIFFGINGLLLYFRLLTIIPFN